MADPTGPIEVASDSNRQIAHASPSHLPAATCPRPPDPIAVPPFLPSRYDLSAVVLSAVVVAPFWFLWHPVVNTTAWLLAAYSGPLIVGGAAYLLRRKHRLVYGLVELMIGIVLGLLTVVPNDTVVGQMVLGYIAATYLIVRAIENIEKGILTKRVAKSWRKIFGIDQSSLRRAV